MLANLALRRGGDYCHSEAIYLYNRYLKTLSELSTGFDIGIVWSAYGFLLHPNKCFYHKSVPRSIHRSGSSIGYAYVFQRERDECMYLSRRIVRVSGTGEDYCLADPRADADLAKRWLSINLLRRGSEILKVNCLGLKQWFNPFGSGYSQTQVTIAFTEAKGYIVDLIR